MVTNGNGRRLSLHRVKHVRSARDDFSIGKRHFRRVRGDFRNMGDDFSSVRGRFSSVKDDFSDIAGSFSGWWRRVSVGEDDFSGVGVDFSRVREGFSVRRVGLTCRGKARGVRVVVWKWQCSGGGRRRFGVARVGGLC